MKLNNKTDILRSVKNVLEKNDIEQLTESAYRFVMNISGFIAHYNIDGFKHRYRNIADLVRNLERSSDIMNPKYYREDWFLERDKEYYMQKADILEGINILINQYKNDSFKRESEMIEVKYNNLLKHIIENKEKSAQVKRDILNNLTIYEL